MHVAAGTATISIWRSRRPASHFSPSITEVPETYLSHQAWWQVPLTAELSHSPESTFQEFITLKLDFITLNQFLLEVSWETSSPLGRELMKSFTCASGRSDKQSHWDSEDENQQVHCRATSQGQEGREMEAQESSILWWALTPEPRRVCDSLPECLSPLGTFHCLPPTQPQLPRERELR